jgi:hypothetical protein
MVAARVDIGLSGRRMSRYAATAGFAAHFNVSVLLDVQGNLGNCRVDIGLAGLEGRRISHMVSETLIRRVSETMWSPDAIHEWHGFLRTVSSPLSSSRGLISACSRFSDASFQDLLHAHSSCKTVFKPPQQIPYPRRNVLQTGAVAYFRNSSAQQHSFVF